MAINGKELKKLRIDLDIEQKELAERMGLTSSTLSRWESGRQEIPESHEKLLRYVLDDIIKEMGLNFDLSPVFSKE